MSNNPIELEIRGEITQKDIPNIEKRLIALNFKHKSTTRRTSVMSFGEVHAKGSGWSLKRKQEVDIRCRITNGKSEVVTKLGRTDAANRIEISQPVSLSALLKFASMFGSMSLFTKVGSKITENYTRKTLTVSLVQSPSGLAYIEIEKMSSPEQEKQDLTELQKLGKELQIKIWKSRKEFLTFCARLTKQDDWEFHGTTKDIERLKKEIRHIGADRKTRSKQ